jgi:ADP-heptose:LPS heptosyltransferase
VLAGWRERNPRMKRILLTSSLSPGDVVVASALIRDVHRAYPGQFELGYKGTAESYFWHNPNITKGMVEGAPGVEQYKLTYSLVNQSNKYLVHFMQGYYHDFNKRFGLDVRMTEFKPDIHFSAEELDNPLIKGRYWVIASGGKQDFTTKWWDPQHWQDVVDRLIGEVQFVQVGEKGTHVHPPLKGALNLVGQTSFRDLCRLILHADGVCCVVTCLMHLAAAMNKPCVVVAGGREGWWWEAYTRLNRDQNMKALIGPDWKPAQPDDMVEHVFLHTVGKYDLLCCRDGGCWKSKATRAECVGDQTWCERPIKGPTITQPECLTYIKPEVVAQCVRCYGPRTDGELVDMRKARVQAAQAAILPVTICTLLYGDYPELHARNLHSIINNTPPGDYRLRVGLNQVCPATLKLLSQLSSGRDIQIFESPENIKKYPMMRRMFQGLETRWTVWLDDDSHFTEPDWLKHLIIAIKENEPQGYIMYGKQYFIHLMTSQLEWIRSAKWFGNLPIRIRTFHDHKLGRTQQKVKTDFITGGFWAVRTDWLQKWDWPDPRICHNGGDVMMGEAIYQTGHQIKNWHYGVAISDAKRRGYAEKPAGAK